MRADIAALFAALCLSVLPVAAQELPPGVLEAEMASDWPLASERLRQALGVQPERRDLWRRLAQTEAAAGRRDGAADALQAAALLEPEDAKLFAEASAALAYADRPRAAIEMLARARTLDPNNTDYAMREIELANWLGDSQHALSVFAQLWKDDLRVPRLGYLYAQALSWNGQTDAARDKLQRYLQEPEGRVDPAALLLMSQLESWRGDYSESIVWLDHYRDSGGDPEVYAAEKAAVLAWGDRPHHALALLEALEESPDRSSRRTSAETVALRKLNLNAAVGQRLHELRSARSDGVVDPDGLAMYLTTSLRDTVGVDSHYSLDSDGISIWAAQLTARWWPAPNVMLEGLVAPWRIGLSDPNAALSADAAVAALNMTQLGVAVQWFPSGHWQLRVAAGQVFVDDPESDRMDTAELALAYRPNDAVRFRITADRAPHAVSPRALDRAIFRDEFAVGLNWRPDLRWDFNLRLAEARFGSQSDCAVCQDANKRSQILLSAMKSLMFRQDWSASAGARAIVSRFDQDLDHGYYDPRRFDNVALVGNIYHSVSRNQGIALTMSLGVQRDPAIDSAFTPALDLSTQWSFGIWSDTQVNLRLAGSYGVSRVGEDYSAANIGVSVIRRF